MSSNAHDPAPNYVSAYCVHALADWPLAEKYMKRKHAKLDHDFLIPGNMKNVFHVYPIAQVGKNPFSQGKLVGTPFGASYQSS